MRVLLISLLAMRALADGQINGWGQINSKMDAIKMAADAVILWTSDVSNDTRWSDSRLLRPL